MIFATNHGAERIRKRLGCPKCGADKAALEALDKGLSAEQARGLLRAWLDERGTATGVELRIWRNQLWIFGSNQLITCYPIPGRLAESAARQIAKRKEPHGRDH